MTKALISHVKRPTVRLENQMSRGRGGGHPWFEHTQIFTSEFHEVRI